MTDSPSMPGSAESEQSDALDAAREAELIQGVIRAQERHREGGVGIEPSLEVQDDEADPDA